ALLDWSLPNATAPLSTAGPAPGLLIGRVSREAWIASISATAEWDGIKAVIGRDDTDLLDLELELSERINGEVVHAHRVRLDELNVSGLLSEKFVNVEL